jgi:pimeloyl-ACP methyl ester carboxylesterase
MVSGLYQVVPALIASRRRRAMSPGVAAREWAVASASSVLRPTGFVLGRASRSGQRPVVLVHGYGMGRSNFLLLARRLRQAGIGPTIGFEYWSLASIARSSARLSGFLERLCRRHGWSQVAVVGHSLGGVVGRHALTIGRSPHIGQLITLGSPHAGTQHAWLGLGPASREMQPGSALLRDLAAAPIPEHRLAASLWSRADAMVEPAEAARWPGAIERTYQGLGHMSLLASRRVARDIVELLSRDDRRASPSSSR